MGAALAGPDVEHLGDGNADGAGGNEIRLQVFWGKEESGNDQGGADAQGDHGSDVTVLINIGTDHAVDSEADTKR
ncbi:MAG: hypothetical protein RLZZ519_2996 [Bacteroidota bacterium]